MKIAYVLPRNMSFSAQSATAIDLCARENIKHSSYISTTKVFGQKIDNPFHDIEYIGVTSRYGTIIASNLIKNLQTFKPNVIMVEQFAPIGRSIRANLPNAKIVLRKHANNKKHRNFVKAWNLRRDFRAYDNVVFVSNYTRNSYTNIIPELKAKSTVIYNGFNPQDWPLNPDKSNTILFAGRCAAEKGADVAARAALQVLNTNSNWDARFVFSTFGCDHNYISFVHDLLRQPQTNRIHVEFDLPHSEVRGRFLDSAICIAPAIKPEPFGRTSLESLASGCVLVCSKVGGVSEVVSQHCIDIDPRDHNHISSEIIRLINSPSLRNRGGPSFSTS